jgi:transcriptional regulator with XRE-family HTH domain
MSTLAERLSEAMKGPPKVSGATLAKACRVKPPSVSDWLSGKTKTMEGSNLLAAARCLNVDPDWLATGIGTKKFRSARHVAEESPPYLSDHATIDAAIALVRQIAPDQLPETISFLKWQLASKAPPRDGQALRVAGK